MTTTEREGRPAPKGPREDAAKFGWKPGEVEVTKPGDDAKAKKEPS